MPVNIIVTAKQVIDPETPASSLRLNAQTKRMETPPNVPPVINGFDENAVEAALRIKDAQGGKVTVISVGKAFVTDVVKKPLSMGCDELVLIQDDAADTFDGYATAQVLAAAIKKIGTYDLVICGRQASDFDQAYVPLGIAELLGIPCVTIGQKVDVKDKNVTVGRAFADSTEVVESPMPALVTVSNELGQPRYPSLRGIMAAGRKQPISWKLADLGLNAAQLEAKVEMLELFIPAREKKCEIIDGENEEDKGRKLALKLREAKLI
ncbi:MAG: electron transfer flavoprotein subunit beta/FixA family protein [Dehalococcoidia bacterium]|nr:electron transfer flavoprotein subunit beta/FixA family protein [Dehalococcoidia bacterium]